MPNTSATGGYLADVTPPAEGVALRRFIGELLRGVTGLPGDMVRPSWQENPPPMPAYGTDWLAYGVTARRVEAGDPWQAERADGSGSYLRRHESLDVQVTAYGANAEGILAALRDGLDVAQNREQLFLANVTVVECGQIIHAPELVNERWWNRADMTVTLRREVRREYPILHFVGADAKIVADGSRVFVTDLKVRQNP